MIFKASFLELSLALTSKASTQMTLSFFFLEHAVLPFLVAERHENNPVKDGN